MSFPLSFAPGRYRPRTSGRGQVSDTDLDYVFDIVEPPIDVLTHNVRPHVATHLRGALSILVLRASATRILPGQRALLLSRALRGLIHHANLARDAGRDTIDAAVRDRLIKELKDGVLVGLSDTTSHGDKPGERKTRLLLEVPRDREPDVLRFAHDLRVPPTSNQAERDRPAKIQQKISGRLTSEKRTEDRYRIRGNLSTPPQPDPPSRYQRRRHNHPGGHHAMPSGSKTARHCRA